MKVKPVSIVIPTLNEEQYLPRLLESLVSVTSPLDIIVVDGASEDGTVHVVERFSSSFQRDSSLTLIQSPERGISLQRNKGAEQATHDILIFCDADIVFPSDEVFQRIVTELVEKKYAVAAPLLRPIESGNDLKRLYHILTLMQKLLLFFGRPFFAGSCLLTSKDVFKRAGGFDETIMLGEDVDYSIRAAKLGRAGLVHIELPVSARRAIKYGYKWLLSELPNLFRFLLTGKLKSETIYYPFGEYGGQKPHHVTRNTG
ncbi:MAG: hypothetical protein AB199_01775 [Parcubacteria bacterium C7867-004]|nr:MAG: hypothetical protein AB199_01775 [Parcubacteria bacterium C7867-004]